MSLDKLFKKWYSIGRSEVVKDQSSIDQVVVAQVGSCCSWLLSLYVANPVCLVVGMLAMALFMCDCG